MSRGRSTRIIHPLTRSSRKFQSLATPIYRGSTVVFDTLAEASERHGDPEQYRYGLAGTPTSRELEIRLAEIEGASQVLLVPSGLAAISLVMLGLAKAGAHILIPDNVYGPTRRLGQTFLNRFQVAVEFYDPLIGEGIANLIRDTTALVWTESPGSITMEVQDIPAICAAARAKGVPVAIDNTYGAGMLFDSFAAGVDVSVQALTKYQAGHGDLLMGSVATRDDKLGKRLAADHKTLGLGVSPDECALVLRGMATMPLRMKHIGAAALDVALWLKAREEVESVLHPALPDCGGHDVWKRDWNGSAGIFSFVARDWSRAQVETFVDALELFKIGFSWGGPVSLVFAYEGLPRPTPEQGDRLVRLSIGLEDVEDLKADLDQAFARANAL